MARITHLDQARLRNQARRDLFWLCNNVLGYQLVERVHRPLCDFFVQKNASRSLYEQDSNKLRLLLYPRGHYKTTIDIADAIQWILNFPDIRILMVTGTVELAKRMILEMKWHFQGNEKLRSLFPEFCPPVGSEWGSTDSFTVPNRQRAYLREPTVSISTIDSIKAGSHYDVIKCDDVVNEINSATRLQVDKTIQAFQYMTPLLDPGGYRDVIGTRYDFSDLYGGLLATKGWASLVQPAWESAPDGTKRLLFPERFSLALLESIQNENPYLFNCQYLNNPIATDTQHFTKELLLTHFLPQVPTDIRMFMAWDLGYSTKETADYSVGAIGGYGSDGKLFVCHLERGRFAPSELVERIVDCYRRWPIQRVGIEESAGSRLLQPAIDAKCQMLRMYMPVEWIKPSNVKNSKLLRIESLEALLKAGKLWFANGIAHKDALLTEFTQFPKYRHDDVPDSISMLLHFRNKVDVYIDPNYTDIMTVREAPLYADDDPILGAGIVG